MMKKPNLLFSFSNSEETPVAQADTPDHAGEFTSQQMTCEEDLDLDRHVLTEEEIQVIAHKTRMNWKSQYSHFDHASH